MKEDKQKEVQQKYMELQVMQQQMKQVQQQLQQFEQQQLELAVLEESLDNIKNVKTGSEIFVPLSSGIFAKAELKDNKDMLVNVGSGTVVKKSVEDTKKLIEKQSSEINKMKKQMMEQLQKLAGAAQKTEKDLASLMESAK